MPAPIPLPLNSPSVAQAISTMLAQGVSKVLYGAGFAGLFAVSTFASAQDAFDPDDALSFKLGETDVYPSVRIDYLQNSNAFLTPANPTEASDITISPQLNWVANRRLIELLGTYQGSYNSSSEEALNYADHMVSLEANAELSSRQRVRAKLSLDFGHEDLGTNLTRGAATEDSDLVQFTNIQATTSFQYGANRARGNIIVGLDLQDFGYNSRSDVTAGRGFSVFEPFAEFSLRLSGDTRAVTELRFATVNFDNKDRDRTDLSFLVGMQFAATGKSGGGFRLGVLQTQPDRSGVNDSTEFVASASLFWEPASFSRFTLRGDRVLDNEGSSLISTDALASVRNTVVLDWDHEWSSRISHVARLRSENVDRVCPGRGNTSLVGSLELNVQVRRWFSVGVSGMGSNGIYTDCPGEDNQDFDFERTRFGAHVRATL